MAPVVATALGASMIEKHFIVDRNLGGVDSAFSMDKNEFKEMVVQIRNAEKCIGTLSYEPSESMISGRRVARSLYVAEDMKCGDIISCKNIKSVRPGYGLHPKFLPSIIGKKVNTDLKKGCRFEMRFIKE